MATIGKGLLPMQKAFIDMASTIMPIIAPVIQDIFGLFSGAFTWIAEVINENKDSIQEGLSSAMNEVKFVISSLGKVIRWCVDNLGFLVPVLKAVAGGFVAFNGISKIMPLIKGITGGLISVIKAVRVIVAVLAANPILIAIMAVVAGIYLLVTHWEEIKEVAIEVWTAVSEFISETWDGIVNAVTGFIDRVSALISELYESIITTLRPILDDVTQIFNGITDFLTGVFTGNWDLAFSGLVQIFTGYFDIIRNVAEGVLNWVQDKLQWAADAIQGIRDTGSAIINGTVGKLVGNGNATGTEYWQGGLTYVNENQRGEIINLPNGSQVIPHDESMKQLANSGGGVTVNMTIQGNVIGNEAFMNECGKHITEKIMLAMNNM